jgi:hypothetical protein
MTTASRGGANRANFNPKFTEVGYHPSQPRGKH